jgi:hypothetical protein
VVLPGNEESDTPTAFSALVDVSPTVFSFSASMAVEGADLTQTRDDETRPAWPNAFGLNGLDIYALAFSAGITPAGLPGEVGFAAQMSLKADSLRYIFGIAGVVSAAPNRLLIKLETQNINPCIFFVLAKVIVGQAGGAFSPLDKVTTLCMAFNFIRFDYFLFYFSTGAQIGGLYFPPGGKLEAHVSLFGKWRLLDVVGEFNMAQMKAALNGTISGFALGPVAVSGYKSKDITASHALTTAGDVCQRAQRLTCSLRSCCSLRQFALPSVCSVRFRIIAIYEERVHQRGPETLLSRACSGDCDRRRLVRFRFRAVAAAGSEHLAERARGDPDPRPRSDGRRVQRECAARLRPLRSEILHRGGS